MFQPKFYFCKKCGNLASMLIDSKVVPVCCNEPMVELKANTEDAAVEKHVPVIEVEGNIVTVTVGSTIHPSTEEHHINFIYLLTDRGAQRKNPVVGEDPIATFAIEDGEKVVAAYEYCNLHGLWKKEL
jgi:superoxide reductase